MGSGDQRLARKATLHPNMPAEDRLAHMDLDDAGDLCRLARFANTAVGTLRDLAGPDRPAAVRAAAVQHADFPLAEAVATVLGSFARHEMSRVGRCVPLVEALLAATDDIAVARAIVAGVPAYSQLGQATKDRLTALDDHGLDARMATFARHRGDDAWAATIAERAIAALEERRRPFDADSSDPALLLAGNVIQFRAWTSAQGGRLFTAALACSPEHGPRPQVRCWLCSSVAVSASVAGLPSSVAARLAVHLAPPTPVPVQQDQIAGHRRTLVLTAVGPDGPLVEAASRVPALAATVMERRPDDLRLALDLGRRHHQYRSLIAGAASPRLRPRLRAEFFLDRPRLRGPSGDQDFRIGRYRYDTRRPGWVVAASGRPARKDAVLRALAGGGPLRIDRLLVAHDGLRTAVRHVGLRKELAAEGRLLAEVATFEEAVDEWAASLGPHDSVSGLFQGPADELAAMFHQAAFDIRSRHNDLADLAGFEKAIAGLVAEGGGMRELALELLRAKRSRLADLMGPELEQHLQVVA